MHAVNRCKNSKGILACLQHPEEFANEDKVQGNKLLIKEGTVTFRANLVQMSQANQVEMEAG